MEFREFSGEEWAFIEPILPPRAGVDDRIVLNGILFMLITCCRWMNMPSSYGSYATAWDRFSGWSRTGVWAKMLEALTAKGYSTGRLSRRTVR